MKTKHRVQRRIAQRTHDASLHVTAASGSSDSRGLLAGAHIDGQLSVVGRRRDWRIDKLSAGLEPDALQCTRSQRGDGDGQPSGGVREWKSQQPRRLCLTVIYSMLYYYCAVDGGFDPVTGVMQRSEDVGLRFYRCRSRSRWSSWTRWGQSWPSGGQCTAWP